MRKFLVALSVLGLLASACGESGDKAKTVSADTTTKPAADTSGDLNAKLLTVADLPTGYSPSDSDDDSSDSSEDDFCKELQDFETRYKSKEEAEVSFQKGEPSLAGFAALNESVARFGSSREADTAFDGFSSAMTNCKTFETTDEDGTFKGSFAPLSFQKLGDDTFAAHLKGTGGSEDFTLDLSGDFVAIRKNDVVVVLFTIGFGAVTIPPTELETIAKTAVAKV